MIDTICLIQKDYRNVGQRDQFQTRDTHRFKHFAICPIDLGNGTFAKACLIEFHGAQNCTLFLSVELPKVIHGHNAMLLSESETIVALEALEQRLRDSEFNLSLCDMGICGLQIAHDFRRTKPFQLYLNLLGEMCVPRLDLSTFRSGIAFTNKSRRISIHDKFSAQRAKGLKWPLDHQVLRFEYQLRGMKPVQRFIGASTLAGLLDNYARITRRFRSQVRDWIGSIAISTSIDAKNRLIESVRQPDKHRGVNALLVEALSVVIQDHFGDHNSFKQQLWPLITRGQQNTLRRYLKRHKVNRLIDSVDAFALQAELLDQL